MPALQSPGRRRPPRPRQPRRPRCAPSLNNNPKTPVSSPHASVWQLLCHASLASLALALLQVHVPPRGMHSRWVT